MRRCFILTIFALLIMRFGSAEAGVGATFHDMFTQGKGTDKNVCSYCHVPHNAIGDKIWSNWNKSAMPTEYSPIGNMCYTCHDGTITSVGAATVFDLTKQQHKLSPGKDCNMCHTVHDNTNGKFSGIAKAKGALSESATYCEACHAAAMYSGAESLGDHTAGSEHPYKDSGDVLDKSCASCHQMHGAASYTAGSLTNPILKQGNVDSAYCASSGCHSTVAQATTGGNKHPANMPSAGTWGNVNCDKCHDVHQPTQPGRTAILLSDNTDSKYCKSCHKADDMSGGPNTGSHMHPLDVSFATKGSMPSGKDIDDNGNGADYPGNSQALICETCHSVHKKGVAKPLLRITPDGGVFCDNCHPGKK